MKKILYSLAALSIAFGLTSCKPENRVIFNPEEVVAPVLESIGSEYLLVEGETMAELKFSPADFGFAAAVKYSAFVDLASNEESKAKEVASVTGSYADSVITLPLPSASVNNALLSLGASFGSPVSAKIFIKAQAYGEKLPIDNCVAVSNEITTDITPYDAEKVYAKVYVIGSYCGWKHDKSLFLFNYAEDGTNFTGIIDFTEEFENNEFKLTDQGDWNGGNWGLAEEISDIEAGELQLINDGGSKNITGYNQHRFYNFQFNNSTLVFTFKKSFDQVGVIGLNGDWENDVVMDYYPAKQLFYADVEAADATEFKFRLDADWGTNWGVDGALGAGNISLPAGKYRIYLDLNDIDAVTYKISADDYGVDLGGGEDPEEPEDPEDPKIDNAWSIIGSVAGSNWDKDFYMKEVSAGIWVSSPIEFAEGDKFKIRFNNDWPDNRGLADADDSLVEGTPKEAVLGGNDIAAVAGKSTVVYDANNESLYLLGWGLTGTLSGLNWDYDVPLYLDADGNWIAKGIDLSGKFKLRYQADWVQNYGGAAQIGTFSLEAGGSDMVLEGASGLYDVLFNATDLTFTISVAE